MQYIRLSLISERLIRFLSVAVIALPLFVASASAQVKIVLFQDTTLVNTKPSKLPLIANFELAEDCPGLQSSMSKFLFEVLQDFVLVGGNSQ